MNGRETKITKKKLVTLPVKAQWSHIVQQCIDSIIAEPARTDNCGQRSKIRVAFPASYKFGKPFPKCVFVPSDNPDIIIREWTCATLIDWCNKWGLSDYSAHDIYSQRRGVLKSLDWMCKEMGISGMDEIA